LRRAIGIRIEAHVLARHFPALLFDQERAGDQARFVVGAIAVANGVEHAQQHGALHVGDVERDLFGAAVVVGRDRGRCRPLARLRLGFGSRVASFFSAGTSFSASSLVITGCASRLCGSMNTRGFGAFLPMPRSASRT
jgi:hypothetical protein